MKFQLMERDKLERRQNKKKRADREEGETHFCMNTKNPQKTS
jgi:hypothetical protein